MSEVCQVTRYFQKCDICGTNVELSKKADELKSVKIPITYFSEGERSKCPSIAWLSLCDACMNELKSLIETKWQIVEFEYGGIVAKKVGEQSE